MTKLEDLEERVAIMEAALRTIKSSYPHYDFNVWEYIDDLLRDLSERE